MASATLVLASENNGQSTVSVTFDDATFVVSAISWVNPTGTWSITIVKSGSVVDQRVLAPGATGSVAIPKGRGMHWFTNDKSGSDWTFESEWRP